jgi:hypothetical protein
MISMDRCCHSFIGLLKTAMTADAVDAAPPAKSSRYE